MAMTEYVEFDFNPHHLPNDLLIAIGRVVTASTQTENIVNMAIAGCLGIDFEYQVAVTQHMPLPLKFSVLQSAAEIRLDDLDALDELDDLLERIKAALEKRNGIVHDSWATEPLGRTVHRVTQKARVRVEANMMAVNVADVGNDANEIVAAGLALMKFLQDRDLIPAYPSGRPRGHKSKAARKERRARPPK